MFLKLAEKWSFYKRRVSKKKSVFLQTDKVLLSQIAHQHIRNVRLLQKLNQLLSLKSFTRKPANVCKYSLNPLIIYKQIGFL